MSTDTGGGTVVGTQQVMRLNSLYDPDYTGSGHQPYGFDQMSGMYQKYRVDHVDFQVLFTTPGAANDMLCLATVAPNTTSNLTGVAMYAAQERPNSIVGHLSSQGERKCVLNGSFDLHTLCGVPKAKYVAEEQYSAAINADPTVVPLLTFAVGSYSNAVSQACSVQVVLSYRATLFQRATQATS